MRVKTSRAVPVVLAILLLGLPKAGLPAGAGAGTRELSGPAAADGLPVVQPGPSPVADTRGSAEDGPSPAPAGADNVARGEPAAPPAAPAASDNTATPAAGPGTDDTGQAPAGVAEGPGPEEEIGEVPATIADPLEPVNRAVFVFNDKAYFWVLKPVARGYNAVVPQTARALVRNFFSNLATPIRFVNNLLQGKVKGAGTELLRLGINSTIGIGGLFDAAKTGFHVEKRDEDLGQTLGRYGLGGGFYIVWPLLGPSSARDTVGMAGDAFLDPVNYLNDPWAAAGVKAFKSENEVSLSLGDYEALTESALDPYVAVRDAYIQNRRKKVRE